MVTCHAATVHYHYNAPAVFWSVGVDNATSAGHLEYGHFRIESNTDANGNCCLSRLWGDLRKAVEGFHRHSGSFPDGTGRSLAAQISSPGREAQSAGGGLHLGMYLTRFLQTETEQKGPQRHPHNCQKLSTVWPVKRRLVGPKSKPSVYIGRP